MIPLTCRSSTWSGCGVPGPWIGWPVSSADDRPADDRPADDRPDNDRPDNDRPDNDRPDNVRAGELRMTTKHTRSIKARLALVVPFDDTATGGCLSYRLITWLTTLSVETKRGQWRCVH